MLSWRWIRTVEAVPAAGKYEACCAMPGSTTRGRPALFALLVLSES